MILENKNFKINVLLIASLIIVIIANFRLLNYEHHLAITENPPTAQMVKINAMGDNQLLFRYLSLELQYMGDSFGRSSNINKYDYQKLYQWFKLLDSLDNRSNFTPSTAAYYFGYNYNSKQLTWVIRYLKEHSWDNLEYKWWWLYQASYLAYHRQKDYNLAIELAKKVALTKAQVPIWVKQLPALYYAQIGEHQHALAIIREILVENQSSISAGEKNFMNYFIDQRLKEINSKNK